MGDEDELLGRVVELAREGAERGEGGPFGCVIARGGSVVAEGWNRVIADNDPTAHAEVVAIRRACAALGSYQLAECVVYASCEPCPMCLGAIYWARPAEVVYAAGRTDAADAGFDDAFIYKEMARPVSDRRIPFRQVETPGAAEAMQVWAGRAERLRY